MENQIAYFKREELAYISRILRGAFEIRTAEDEEDEVLGDFIQALDEGYIICEDGEDELLRGIDARDSE